MSYGKVISGGKQMSKGLTKGINDKLAGFSKENERRAVVAGAVRRTYDQNPLSDQHKNNVNGGKFTVPKLPTKV
jgi:hypothetical protein